MKKMSILVALVILSAAGVAVAQRKGYVEHFTNPVDTNVWHPNKGITSDGTPMFVMSQEDGAMKVVMHQETFPDGQFFDFSKIGITFNLNDNAMVSMKIKLEPGATWGTDAVSTVPFMLSPWDKTADNGGTREHSNITFDVPADGSWNEWVFDWMEPDLDQVTYPNDYSSITAFLFETVRWPSAHTATFWIDDFCIGDTTKSSVDRSVSTPDAFHLAQNYPNPFNPATRIFYRLPRESSVRLTIVDFCGKTVATPVNGRQSAGPHEIEFTATDLASGVYFYRLQAGAFSETRRMVLIR